tara:strand:- start:11215 stop:11481 length:267 start_codon:yes stop_codon:yes gene_type:complete
MSETKPQEQIVEITTYLAQVEMDYHDEVQAQVFGELVEAENFIKEMLEEVMEDENIPELGEKLLQVLRGKYHGDYAITPSVVKVKLVK